MNRTPFENHGILGCKKKGKENKYDGIGERARERKREGGRERERERERRKRGVTDVKTRELCASQTVSLHHDTPLAAALIHATIT